MKKITDLKKGDVVEVNKEKFEVGMCFEGERIIKTNLVIMIIYLIKVGQQPVAPGPSLRYSSLNPKEVEFYIGSVKQKIKSINFG